MRFTLCLLFYTCLFVSSQTTFEKHFGSPPYHEYCSSMLPIDDGGFYLGCISVVDPEKGADIWLIRFGQSGDTLWSRKIGSANNENLTDMIYSDGSLMFTGRVTVANSQKGDLFCVMTDLIGNVLWYKTYPSIRDSRGFQIVRAAEGFFVAGTIEDNSNNGTYNIVVMKVSGDGTMQWNYEINAGENISFINFEALNDGTYFLTATTTNVSFPSYLYHLDSNCNTIWQGTLANGLRVTKVSQIINNQIIMGGYTYTNGDFTPAVNCIDFSGNTIWSIDFPATTTSYSSIDAIISGSGDTFSMVVFLDMINSIQTYLWVVSKDGLGSTHMLLNNIGENSFFLTGIELPDERIWLAGQTYEISGSADVILKETDKQISFQNTKVFGISDEPGYEGGYKVFHTSEGDYLIAGYKYVYDGEYGNRQNSWVLKVNPFGQLIWDKLLSTSGQSQSWDIVESNSGDYLIFSTGNDSVGGFVRIDKVNKSGEDLWHSVMRVEPLNVFGSLVELEDGKIIIGTTLTNPSNFSLNPAMIVTSSLGDSLDTHFFDFSNAICYNLIKANDNGFLLSGSMPIPGKSSDVLVIKVDENFGLAWYRNYGTTASERSTSLIQTADGVIYSYGLVYSYGSEKSMILKLNSSGDSIGSGYVGDPENYSLRGYRIIETSDNELVVVSLKNYQPQNMNNRLGCISKFDKQLNLLWERDFGHSLALIPYDIKATTDGGLIICGIGSYSFFGSEVFLLKTDKYGFTNAQPLIKLQSDNALLMYPNPSGGSVFVESIFGDGEKVCVEIVDMAGNVRMRSDFFIEEPTRNLLVNLESMPDGVYILTLKSESRRYSSKLIIRK